MSLEKSTQVNKALKSNVFLASGVLQRKCACGNHTNAAAITNHNIGMPSNALEETHFNHNFSEIKLHHQAAVRSQNQLVGPTLIPRQQCANAEHNQFQTKTIVKRYPLRAKLRRGTPPPIGFSRFDPHAGRKYGDERYFSALEQPGFERKSDSAIALQRSTTGTIRNDMESGEATLAPIDVEDLGSPTLAALGRNDAVNAGFTYSGSINRGGAAPTGFGVTRSFSSNLTGKVITPRPGTFDVNATFEHPITYQVRSGTGPRSQVDIASDTDPDITSANYTTVVSDLTPNMGDLNGRPPRSSFWSEDLTLRHELVHANDDNTNGPSAMATVTTWLNGQTAANVAQVETLLGRLPGRFGAALLAALSTAAGERNAYGDGAPSYLARANAIKTKGDAGGYPGLSTGAKAAIGIGGGALAGAGIGALVGGPVGAAAGAGIGALVGGLGSLLF